ncbi:hypothetical protein PGB90_001245 [Kerria lacca]
MESNGCENFEIIIPNKNQKDVDTNILSCIRKRINIKISRLKSTGCLIGKFCGHCAVLVYVIAAGMHWYKEGQKPLSPVEGLGSFLLFMIIFYWSLFYYKFLKPSLFLQLRDLQPAKSTFFWSFVSSYSKKLFYIIPPILFIVFLIYDTANDRSRLISLSGIFVIYIFGYLFSKHPSKIRWDILYRATMIQVIMAICTVRWEKGKFFFENVGNKIEKFLSYGYVGAAFVYSDNLIYKQVVFAFQCLSIIYFINFLVEILFYYQILQRAFAKLGWFLQTAIGTTTIETINSCVTVMLGLSEASLIIKIYLKDLTLSELQTVMLGQLSTVAGSVFAAYVSFGVDPGYLVTASVMSAPAALCLSKLLYPETENSKTAAHVFKIDKSYKEKFPSALSAGCEGAFSAVHIVNSTIASLIAFTSLVALMNGLVIWLGNLVGIEDLTIISILGKFFAPIAFLMGVDISQCEVVGKLIATKSILNELVAYKQLGELKKMNILSKKSEALVTYALCSFSNPASVASQMAILSTLCHEHRPNYAKLAFRAYIGGIVTCIMTACVAGLLTPSNNLYEIPTVINNTNVSFSFL